MLICGRRLVGLLQGVKQKLEMWVGTFCRIASSIGVWLAIVDKTLTGFAVDKCWRARASTDLRSICYLNSLKDAQ